MLSPTARYHELAADLRYAALEMPEPLIELELLGSATGASIQVTQRAVSDDDVHAVVEGRIIEIDRDADWARMTPLALVYYFSCCSWADASPQGLSDRLPHDEWFVADVVRRLAYVDGDLRFEVTMVRERALQTVVIVRRDLSFRIETRGRGRAVDRWIKGLVGHRGVPHLPPWRKLEESRSLN